MRTTAVLDPGKKVAGVALFDESTLVACTLIRGEDPLDVAVRAVDWITKAQVAAWDFDPYESLSEFVSEAQQVYPGAQKTDPNDLFPLSFCCGAAHALVNADKRTTVLPRIWTKGTPKDIRVARIENDLSEAETKILNAMKCAKALRHNVLDSIGLGKWYLGG